MKQNLFENLKQIVYYSFQFTWKYLNIISSNYYFNTGLATNSLN